MIDILGKLPCIIFFLYSAASLYMRKVNRSASKSGALEFCDNPIRESVSFSPARAATKRSRKSVCNCVCVSVRGRDYCGALMEIVAKSISQRLSTACFPTRCATESAKWLLLESCVCARARAPRAGCTLAALTPVKCTFVCFVCVPPLLLFGGGECAARHSTMYR